MKKTIFALFGLVLALVLLTASAAAQTALTASITTPVENAKFALGANGATVPFSAQAANGTAPYNFVWDFGDGTSAAGQSFSKVFNQVGARTITLTVNDFAGGRVTVTRHIEIRDTNPPPPTALTISNLRVTDVTQNSVTVRWTTNRAASSRVLFDTVSHPSITGQTAPNFGYGFSTETTDSATKVTEHAVTVSTLSPSTTYFFRAVSEE